MRDRSRCLPYRWILPIVQLFVCVIVLWPIRRTAQFDPHHPDGKRSTTNVGLRMDAPVLINLPVKLVELPCVLVDRAETDCVPKGITIEGWRALSFPSVGLIFWWIVGRAVEALVSARQSKIHPRISWIEAGVGLLVLGLGLLIFVVNIVQGVRTNPTWVPLAASSAVWAVLGSSTIAAWFAQRTIRLRQRDEGSIEKLPF